MNLLKKGMLKQSHETNLQESKARAEKSIKTTKVPSLYKRRQINSMKVENEKKSTVIFEEQTSHISTDL